jgi:phage tail-like protein
VAQTGQRVDPFRNFNFLVELDGIAQASFTECSGLGSHTEVIENREGGDNISAHKLPGRTTFSDISLKWGMTESGELWTWRQQIVDGVVVRKNGSIVVFDLANQTEVARWNFARAWPSAWEGPAFSARESQVAIEHLTIAHEGITRVLG